MKTPDKIYISIERTYGASDGQVIAMVTPHNERQSINDIEYIRKDALLEWAKEHKCVIETHGDEKDAYLRGEYSVLNSLTDQLNSI